MDKNVQQILKELRSRGMSQSELSRLTGIPQPRISRWESGDVPDSANDSLALLAILRNEPMDLA